MLIILFIVPVCSLISLYVLVDGILEESISVGGNGD